MEFNTPILFIVFNRLKTTQQVFEKIKEVKPKKLFVAADGPRKNKEDEKEKTESVRKFILDSIDWDCEVKTLFRDENLGCGRSVSGAITWFFENVEEGIILEDDTVPDRSFFTFCELMLNKYRNENKIKIIGGVNFQDGIKRGEASYYFTRLCYIWGWATWRRTWKEYDFTLSSITMQNVEKSTFEYFKDKRIVNEWVSIYENLKNGTYDTWDYQLALSIWKKDGINIIPQKNLVTNIGYGKDATHTTQSSGPFSNVAVEKLEEIEYASEIVPDFEADKYLLKKMFPIPKRTLRSIGGSILRKFKNN